MKFKHKKIKEFINPEGNFIGKEHKKKTISKVKASGTNQDSENLRQPPTIFRGGAIGTTGLSRILVSNQIPEKNKKLKKLLEDMISNKEVPNLITIEELKEKKPDIFNKTIELISLLKVEESEDSYVAVLLSILNVMPHFEINGILAKAVKNKLEQVQNLITDQKNG